MVEIFGRFSSPIYCLGRYVYHGIVCSHLRICAGFQIIRSWGGVLD